jgi:hypothetical protein
MQTKSSRLLYGLVLGAIGLVLSAVAIDTQMTNAINAHFFPEDAEAIRWWPVWAWAGLAIVCACEALFGVIWRRITKGSP